MSLFCLRNGVSHYDAQTGCGFQCVRTAACGKVKSAALEDCEFAVEVAHHNRQGGSPDETGGPSLPTPAEKYPVPTMRLPGEKRNVLTQWEVGGMIRHRGAWKWNPSYTVYGTSNNINKQINKENIAPGGVEDGLHQHTCLQPTKWVSVPRMNEGLLQRSLY